MPERKKRTYDSENRQIQAAQTKQRILTAAKDLFQSEGFDAVTIDKLAQASSVAVPTIYALFQSKRGVLRALMSQALPEEQKHALLEEASDKPAKDRIYIAAKISRQMYDAEHALMDIFQSASVIAPEFKALEIEREQSRYERLEQTVKTLAKEKSLQKGLTVKKARDILWTFTGRDMYRMLVMERGWTSDEYEKWLAQLLVNTLIS